MHEVITYSTTHAASTPAAMSLDSRPGGCGLRRFGHGFGHRESVVALMDAELMRTDADRGLARVAPDHKTGRLQIDRVGFLPDRPVDPQFHVRTHRQGMAAFKGHSDFAHVPRDPVAPPVLHAFFGLAVSQSEMNTETCASAPLFRRLLHVGVSSHCPSRQ